MAKTTARSRTPIKNPLSSCRSPTTSSNSPVSLLRMFYDRGAPGPLAPPNWSRTPLNDASISSGRGKTIIVFFSVPISTKVWRYRNWMAAGCFWIPSAAMASFSDAEYSPSAENMAPIDLISALVSDELACRSNRLLERRHKQAQFRDADKRLDTFDFQIQRSEERR